MATVSILAFAASVTSKVMNSRTSMAFPCALFNMTAPVGMGWIDFLFLARVRIHQRLENIWHDGCGVNCVTRNYDPVNTSRNLDPPKFAIEGPRGAVLTSKTP